MCVCSFAVPFYPTQRGRKGFLETPFHLKHNGIPQRFSSCFPVRSTHLPPQARMEEQGVPCPAGRTATQLPSATKTIHPQFLHPSIHPPVSLQRLYCDKVFYILFDKIKFNFTHYFLRVLPRPCNEQLVQKQFFSDLKPQNV